MNMDHEPNAEAYTLDGPAFAHVKSALMVTVALLEREGMYPFTVTELTAALDSLNTAVCSPVDGRENLVGEWQPIEDFPFPSKWAQACHVMCGHSGKKWIRMGKWYAEQEQWYYSGTNELSQFAQQPGDAPTHWMPLPVPPADS